MLLGEIAHDEAHVLEHAARVGTGLAAHVDHLADVALGSHDLVGAGVNVNLLDVAVGALELNLARRDAALLDVAGGRLDDDGRAVADEGARDGNHLLDLLGAEAKHSGDAKGVGQRLHDVAHARHLHRGSHAQGHLLDEHDLVDNGNLVLEAVVDEHAVITLDDARGDRDAVAGGLVDEARSLLEAHDGRDHDDVVLVVLRAAQRLDVDRVANAHALAARRRGIVANHCGLGDDRLGHGLHGNVADDRCRLVEQNLLDVGDLEVSLLDGHGKRVEDAIDVLEGALDARGGNTGARQENHPARIVDAGKGSLSRGITYVNTSN